MSQVATKRSRVVTGSSRRSQVVTKTSRVETMGLKVAQEGHRDNKELKGGNKWGLR